MTEGWRTAREAGLEGAPFGLLSFGDDGAVLYANDRLHAWLGVAPGALAGASIDKLLTRSARVFYNTHFFPLLKLHGKADEIYLTLLDSAGTEFPVLVSAARDTSGVAPANHCALMTMWRRREFEAALVDARRAAEAATVAKDEFLAVASHELRTPLSAIMGWARLARAGTLDPAMQTRALETIERNAHAQSLLIEDLLDVSRIVSGKLRLSPRAIDLAPVVEAAIETSRPAAHAKNIELLHALDRATGIVYADTDRVQQIVWNLVSNAVKFTPRCGRVQVMLARAGSRAQIQVIDSGQGLDGTQLPYLFDRFWQGDTSSRREHAGLGLGLTLCRSLVELHGGSIRAESEGLGKGTTFVVDFPLAVAAAADAGRGATPAMHAHELPTSSVPLDGISVLVVDDDENTRSLLQMLLTGAGASVRVSASPRDALQMIRTAAPHVLVSDVGMPGKDGVEFIRELRRDRVPDVARIVAIAVTGLARPQDRVVLLRAGFQAHLCKPVEPSELVALIAALAGRANYAPPPEPADG